jgi:3-hydroxyisobutyrate dehydrogenase-like beta-hydroxyacid dehydrogenase
MRIAVLGMGQMGQALVARLLDTGHDVTVWNRTSGRAGPLLERGATETSTVVDAVAQAEVVMTSLSADAAVLEVLRPDGVALALPPEAVIVDSSTVAPGTSRALAAAYPERFAAAPILGGPAALATGEAGLVVAGPPAVLELAEPVFTDIAGAVRHCGDDPGRALVVKLVSNYLLMAGLAVLSEAVAGAQRAGLDDALIVDLFTTSGMVAPGLRNRVADLVNGDHDGWFPPPMGAKDVGLFLDLTAGEDRPLPLAQLVRSRYEDAVVAGWEDKDITTVIELLRR